MHSCTRLGALLIVVRLRPWHNDIGHEDLQDNMHYRMPAHVRTFGASKHYSADTTAPYRGSSLHVVRHDITCSNVSCDSHMIPIVRIAHRRVQQFLLHNLPIFDGSR
jgi:hypothetical protein